MAAKKVLGIMLITIVCSAATNIGIFTTLFAIANAPKESMDVIRLGTSPDYPPFESIQQNGQVLEVAGFDIELAKLLVANISQQLGRPFKLSIEAAFFNALMAGLQSNSYDIVIAAFAIRPERELSVDFSVPYYFSQQCCIVPVADSSIHNETDLVGRNVGVQIGTSGEELAGGLGCTRISFPTVDMLMLDLVNGDLDAAILDIPVAQHFSTAGSVKIAFNFTSAVPEGFGVAMREGQGSSRMMGIINSTIIWLKNTNQIQGLFKDR